MNWNIGGWFGGQLAAILSMLVAGILTAVRDFTTGLLVVLLFAVLMKEMWPAEKGRVIDIRGT